MSYTCRIPDVVGVYVVDSVGEVVVVAEEVEVITQSVTYAAVEFNIGFSYVMNFILRNN